MTLSTRVRSELFSVGLDPRYGSAIHIKIPQTRPFGTVNMKKKIHQEPTTITNEATSKGNYDLEKSPRHGQSWTAEKHDLFLQALKMFPSGPWKYVAYFVGTRTARQVMTHAQKYREKIKRHHRWLLSPIKKSNSRSANNSDLTATTTPEAFEPPAAAGTSPTLNIYPAVPAELQQNDWFDHVSVEDIDAAFRYFQKLSDPSLVPEENGAFLYSDVETNDVWDNYILHRCP
ncbi:Myb-like DNA-binding domain [Phytophthora infestans]|uniref:Myb-like DNA-binding domain n=1 Tax=Phytophthora infestans TaxID=4787 RepID=A0A8S9UI23_PHYIN|nr:Myb-like DNA-binding domain [Phytophthora infestans]